MTARHDGRTRHAIGTGAAERRSERAERVLGLAPAGQSGDGACNVRTTAAPKIVGFAWIMAQNYAARE